MRRLIPLLALAVIAGCGGDATAPSSPVGVYLLKSIDGATIPTTTTKLGPVPATVHNGSLSLEAGGAWTLDILVSQSADGQTFSQTIRETGTYSVSGTKITFIEPPGAPTVGTLDNRRITVVQDGVSFVFEMSAATSTALADFDAVWSNYDRVYPYFDIKRINWDSLRTVYRPRAAASRSTAETVGIVSEMLANLKDVHSWIVQPSGQSVATYVTGKFANWNRSLWDIYMRKYGNAPQPTNWGYAMIGDVPYLYFGAWNRAQFSGAAVDAVLERFRDAPAIVIDVRMNGGGDEGLGQEVASRFYDQARIYRYGAFRNGPGHSDLDNPPRAVLLGPRGSWQFRKPVLVLAGRGSFSATEDFVCMMRVLPHVTIAGDTTGGGAGNPTTIDLRDGWKYSLPRSIDYTTQMQIVEWNGIAPAVVVPMSNADVTAGRDPVLDFAEQWAKKQMSS